MLPRFDGRLVDLTLPVTPAMRGVSCAVAATVAEQGWNATNWTLYSHAGTHMDAPVHYEASPQSIDQIGLDRCVGTAQVVDLSGTQPRALLGPECLGDLEAAWRPDDMLLLRTDWYHRHGTPAYRDALPRISADLARWCVRRRVKLLGVEPPAVADPHDRAEITEVHRILLEGGVVIVEGLAYLDQLTHRQVGLVALPLRLAGGDGAPCRAFAIEPPGSS